MARDADDPSDRWSNGAITPSDATTYSPPARAVLVIGAGDLVVQDAQGNQFTLAVTVTEHPIPIRPAKVMAATTASVVLLY